MAAVIRRVSRRALLTDFGAAGVGLIVLGACSGSSDSVSSTVPSAVESATAEPEVTAGAVATDPPVTDADDDTAPTTNAPSAASSLQFEHVALGNVSAYILVRGNEVAIVDTGRSGSRDDILAGLDVFSLSPANVRHIVLTHNHGDHTGGLSGLEGDMAGATVYGGVGDIESIQSTLSIQQLSDGDEVFGMGVVGTPGHTPGSISLFDTETGLLVAGDAINGDGSGGLTGANPDFTPDLVTAAASVAKLAALGPLIAAFGHGGAPVTDDVAAQLAAIGAG